MAGKRDVMMLTTVRDNAIAVNGKPEVVIDYNICKTFINLSNQLASYCPYAPTITKWYLRIYGFLLNMKRPATAKGRHGLVENDENWRER
ncbi:hypothetical protein ANCDUO_02421 [Ancylostoma duodenale]|uniref:PiggyBac transposable element-derived protein domain-containing protein n=1 Tax=Ancylostoma duodenale TaxID=51022 RepID=A0A0C2DWE4_9BILA|nr:hypothetical protein ANCDUO_02421 [Ancylostoma duodenale]